MSCGFFGKLPASGDFLARGLPVGLQSFIDRWLTRHLAEYARTPELWPQTGIRALLHGPDHTFSLLVVPSRDAAGRHYPVAIYAPSPISDRAAIDAWAQIIYPLAVAAIRDTQKADVFQSELERCQPPENAPEPLDTQQVWADGFLPAPETQLRTLFSSA